MTIDPLLFVSIAIVTPTVALVHSIWLWRLGARVVELEEIAHHLRLEAEFSMVLFKWLDADLGPYYHNVALAVLRELNLKESLSGDVRWRTRGQGVSQVNFKSLLRVLHRIKAITLEDGNASITLHGIRFLRELDDTQSPP